LMQEVGLRISRELGYANDKSSSTVVPLSTNAPGDSITGRKQLFKQARKRRAAAI
jgi:hypothetical protein